MSDVPSEIILEILLRLPAESLFRFRSVCKSWKSIIDDPSFVRSHTTNNHCISPSLLLMGSSYGAFYSFPLDSLNYVNGEQTIHATHTAHSQKLNEFRMALCNGLILFFHYRADKTWVIWNTLTGDFHELPQPDVIDGHPHPMGVAIGYDSRSDDYKVVRVGGFHMEDGAARTLIYSLKSKSWRTIMNCPVNYLISYMIGGVYLNGAVHWISSRERIVALDLATEDYRELQAVPPMPRVSPAQLRSLDAFDGYLVLSDADFGEMGRAWRTWVMRGYGTDEPVWVELFSADEQIVFSGLKQNIRSSLFAYLNSERRLFLLHDNTIIRWDIENRCVKRVTIDGLPGYVKSLKVVPGSLFRFNGGGSTSTAAERTTAGVKRSKEASSNNRLRLIATTIDCSVSRGGGMSECHVGLGKF